MQLIFQDGTTLGLALNDSNLASVLLKIYKHLQNIDIPFREWDDPFYSDNMSYENLVDRLTKFGLKMGIEIDQLQCQTHSQSYFNELHKIYEVRYNGIPDWLDFHEHIHLCEQYGQPKKKVLNLDYRELSGLLERKFDMSWISEFRTQLSPGDVYVAWCELGKSPFSYWIRNEPDNLERLCQLSKPWLTLRPKLQVALTEIDLLQGRSEKREEFDLWWNRYHDGWCAHWNIPSWSLNDMSSVAVVGRVDDFSHIEPLLKNKIFPKRVTL